MDLSVIIVSWNVVEKLQKNLEALFKSQGNFQFEVFLVDNNSQDASVDMVRHNFPNVKLIVNDKNLGFAAANNQAIKEAAGKFILLLNPDMQVGPDTLEKILTWAKTKPSATVIGCKLLSEKGEVLKQVRHFPKFFDQLMIVLKIPHIFPGVLNKYLQPDFNYEVESKVDSIRGSFFLINLENYRALSGLEKPFLDETYFIWFEEVDFCRRVSSWGGEVWYTPITTCVDYVGQSFKQVNIKKTQGYFRDSMLSYFKKWEKPGKYYVLKLAWKIIAPLIKYYG